MSFNEWKEVKLAGIGTTVTGKTPSSKTPDHFGDLIPFVTPTDFKNYHKQIFSAERYLSKKGKEALKGKVLPKNSVIVTCIGSDMGKVAINSIECVTNQQINSIIINKEKVNANFLYYKILNMNEYLKQLARGGTTMPIVNKGTFEQINIQLPCLIEQKAIADTLSCLDDKIELNNNINKTLEEMAQAIFKSWFVDFEPFKDGEFEDSELGRIPKGWRLKALYDFADYTNGASFKKDEYASSGCPIIKISELKNGITSSTEYFSGMKDEKYYIKTGDILFSWSGNPQTSIDTFIWVGGDAILNQHTFKISIKNNDYCFIYLLLKFFKSEFTRIASSKQTTGLGHVTVSDLKRLKFPHDDKIVDEFCTMLNPVIGMYVKNLLENGKLSDTRDTLLQKLMSGEIRVPTEEV